jgi:hypothetical protein
VYEEDKEEEEVSGGPSESGANLGDGADQSSIGGQEQHSYHVSYFGIPKEPKKKQSDRDKYARFLNMRR